MTMALVNGRVSTQEVEITFALNIPHVNAFSFGQHHRNRVIIMGAIPVFEIKVMFSQVFHYNRLHMISD
jgi:hypothetical protein